ncbi:MULTISPECIES: sodium:proton antiporter NhaD [Methylomicrobium]|uniref:Na+/H+ antiporter NhaD-like permease n=1 Tax=Methylomicrobium album BG8 TaxID=686340 RepID=H8GLU0_METAL|nr:MULTISPECIES: sodium:proton antiporter NhaD [Methylomicrobium]EIC30617.1 Na+/H+ antiporter NhaD-like permease [Methylomicrobium album BG8]
MLLFIVRLLGLASLLFPGLGFAQPAAEAAPSFHIDLTHHWAGYFSLVVMVTAYVAAMLEDVIELRKSKPMLLAAALIWFVISLVYQQHGSSLPALTAFKSNLQAYIELLLFIMVSMTYLNSMEDMGIFHALKVWLVSKNLSYRQLFWLTGGLVFLLSSVVNGLTAGLLMGTVVVAVGKNNPRFASLACLNIVVATNAGGTFSPLGGISTLFVWQHGMLGFTQFFKLFLPCLVNFLLPAALMHFALPKDKPSAENAEIHLQRGAKRVIFLFGVTIVLAVSFDTALGLPAAAGMMAGLTLLQFFYYFLQKSYHVKGRYNVEFALFFNADGANSRSEDTRFDIFEKVGRLEWDTLLFFYGAMMGIGGLGFIGYLDTISQVLYGQFSPTLANIMVGLSSAFVDNGTLMFAVLTMHPDIPQGQWLLLTLTLGVGGSLLAIGSAPAIGLLGQAKGLYTFSSHLKWCPVILLGYFASIGVHFLLNAGSF